MEFQLIKSNSSPNISEQTIQSTPTYLEQLEIAKTCIQKPDFDEVERICTDLLNNDNLSNEIQFDINSEIVEIYQAIGDIAPEKLASLYSKLNDNLKPMHQEINATLAKRHEYDYKKDYEKQIIGLNSEAFKLYVAHLKIASELGCVTSSSTLSELYRDGKHLQTDTIQSLIYVGKTAQQATAISTALLNEHAMNKDNVEQIRKTSISNALGKVKICHTPTKANQSFGDIPSQIDKKDF